MEEKDLKELIGFVLLLYIEDKSLREHLTERLTTAINKLFTIQHKEIK